MQQIELNEAKTQLPELLEAAINGEEIIITEHNQPLIKLARIASAKPRRRAGTAQGRVKIPEDFNESYDEFSDSIP